MALALAALSHEVHVAQLEFTEQADILLDENRIDDSRDSVQIHRLRIAREAYDPKSQGLWDCPHTLSLRQAFQSLELLLRDYSFDIYHSWFLYPVGYLTGLLSRREGRPHIASIVGNDVKKYFFSPEKVGLCQAALGNAEWVVGNSRELVDLANALVPLEQRSEVIYNGVHLPEIPWRPAGAERTPVIGFAGIFKYAKGLPYLLKAVAEVASRRKVRLRLVGEMRPAEASVFSALVQRLELDPVLTLESHRNATGIREWLRGLDVFCLPSISEGCPNVLMEAMALGVPSVATDVGAVQQLMDHGHSGLVVPWADSSALAEAIGALLDNPEWARSLGRSARESMRHFSKDREQGAWQDVYQRVLARGRNPLVQV